MWICSQWGFFSIVRKARGEYHIRGRVRKDMENLCGLVGLSYDQILETPGDYRFRIIASDGMVLKVLADLGSSLDYSNFKGRIASLPDQADKLCAYHDLWSAMVRIQGWHSTDGKKEIPPPIRRPAPAWRIPRD